MIFGPVWPFFILRGLLMACGQQRRHEEQQDDNMEKEFAVVLIKSLELAARQYPAPMSIQLGSLYGYNPFLILISTILSQRSQDIVTMPVAQALWERAKNPQELLSIPEAELLAIVKPCGMQDDRVKSLRETCKILIEKFNGQVPGDIDSLLSLPGVGPKTAHLVLAEAFGVPAIAIDTHVMRICQHIGILEEGTSEIEAQEVLETLFPRQLWAMVNRVFVAWGQHVCTVHSPRCVCEERMNAALEHLCETVGDCMGDECEDDNGHSGNGCCSC